MLKHASITRRISLPLGLPPASSRSVSQTVHFLIKKGPGICLCDYPLSAPIHCQTLGLHRWELKEARSVLLWGFFFYSDIQFSSLQEQLISPVSNDRENPYLFSF